MNKHTKQDNLSLILTDNSQNRKTGDMIQAWIILNTPDLKPTEACKTGEDKAICGDCPHRSKSCYVNVGQAPNTIYRALQRGSYDNKTIDTTNKLIRCGAYGDPAFIKLSTWKQLLEPSAGSVGYTHQWKSCDNQYASFLMASCDSPEDRQEAKKLGYRTFRVRRAGEPLLPGEMNCPADHAINPVQCAQCMKCGGTKKQCKDISIVVHGSRAKNF